ncbi:MAG: TonB-dependent receptor [Prevotella sp.]|nr:TonB-dependent receptor [Prevotella sp.]
MKNKKTFLLMAVATAAVVTVAAQTADSRDSLKMEHLQEVVVSGVRAQKNAPYATANINRVELAQFSTSGQELPFLFARTPGVLAWSENGLGTGTTYMRIRGAGDSRINITLDGVPLNSPEDQCVFWANMNSYASLLGSVQIQRGVGTSTNGDGAFGGTVALSMKSPMQRPSAEVSASYGSYNTRNLGGSFSTGIMGNHWILDGAYHETSTDGFIHGTNGRSGSYYGGLTYTASDGFAIRYKNIGNFEKTGQAWNGVTAGTNDLSIMDGTYGTATGIKEYKDMYDRGLGRFNSLYEEMIIGDDGTYTTQRYQMADGSLWDRTTDNFHQNHNILSFAWQATPHLSTTASLHYTYGHGYYSEFRPQNKLSKFGLTATDAEGSNIKRTDFVREKGLTQHTYGFLWNLSYKDQRWDVIGGFSLQEFQGNHFGYITYMANDAVRQKYMQQGDYKYYDSDATKFDGNVFLKAAMHLTQQWDVFADLQYRGVNYWTAGINDKFYDDESGYYNQPLNIRKNYDFFNPKAGISWHQGPHHAYASVAMSHREPERNNYTDNGSYPAPKAEQLKDLELGYTFNEPGLRFGLNGYYMKYTDQFVQTGLLSDIGENLTTNIKDSYRMGIELQGGVDITSWLSMEFNAALSQNKIKDFDEVVEDWDNGTTTIHYDNSTLAFSPSLIANAFIDAHYGGWRAVWHTQDVSRQYLDNTECKDRSLPAYSTSNIQLSYTLRPQSLLREAVLSLNINNVFDSHYAASGWVYSAIYASGGHDNDNRYYQIGFIPMSGRTVMGSVTLRF